MQITIFLHGELKQRFKTKQITLRGDNGNETLASALARLIKMGRSGQAGDLLLADPDANLEPLSEKDLHPAIIILVNDIDYRVRGGLQQPLQAGDAITLIPGIHGG